MEFNYLALLVSAVVPIIIGFVWYNPKTFGNTWMREAEMTEEKMKGGNMIFIFALSLFFSFLIAFIIQALAVHQMGVFSLIGGDVEKALPSYEAFMNDYSDAFRTYKHGAFHGLITGLFFAFPLIGINAMFERKSWKYIIINSGYWITCFIFMGAIVCGWK